MKQALNGSAKDLSRRLRAALLEKHNVELSHCQSLEVMANTLGFRSWHDYLHRAAQASPGEVHHLEPLLSLLPPALKRSTLQQVPISIESLTPTLPLFVDLGQGDVHAVPPSQWPQWRATHTTCSPWPLLPPEAQPYIQPLLQSAISFYWERDDYLMADGLPLALNDDLRADTQGVRLAEWFASLQEAVKGTSHHLRCFYDDDNALKAVRISRGTERVPRKLKLPEARLSVVYGPPVADRSTAALALAHAYSRTRRVWIVDDSELFGDAINALKGRCEVIPMRLGWHLYDDVQHIINEGNVLVLDFKHSDSTWMQTLRMALARGATVILSMIAPDEFGAQLHLATAGIFVDPVYFQRGEWKHAKKRLAAGRTAWFSDATPLRLS